MYAKPAQRPLYIKQHIDEPRHENGGAVSFAALHILLFGAVEWHNIAAAIDDAMDAASIVAVDAAAIDALATGVAATHAARDAAIDAAGNCCCCRHRCCN